MRKEVDDLTKSFPEDDFDLERLKWQTIAQKKRKKTYKVFKPKNVEPEEKSEEKSLSSNNDIVKDETKIESDGSDDFPETNFDLDDFKKNVLTQKRERFWKRNTKLFYFLSTLSMIVLFILAYYIFHFISDLIFIHTSLR